MDLIEDAQWILDMESDTDQLKFDGKVSTYDINKGRCFDITWYIVSIWSGPKIVKNKRHIVISNHFVTIYKDDSLDEVIDKFKIKLVEAVYINQSRDSVILKFEKLPNIMIKSK